MQIHDDESNKLEVKPSREKTLSQQQKNISEADSHLESCSWARQKGDVDHSIGLGVIKAKIISPPKTMLEK